jgi:hypothetical protein
MADMMSPGDMFKEWARFTPVDQMTQSNFHDYVNSQTGLWNTTQTAQAYGDKVVNGVLDGINNFMNSLGSGDNKMLGYLLIALVVVSIFKK